MVKFDRQAVAETLEPGEQIVYLTGRLVDGTPLAGMDTIMVLGEKASESAGDTLDMTLSELADAFLAMAMFDNDLSSSYDTVEGADEEVAVEEAVAFALFEAGDIIGELGAENFTNEESATALSNEIDFALAMMDEGLITEALNVLENNVLERTNGCAEIGSPDENDWITTYEGQVEVHPLIMDAIEFLESLI